MAIENAQIYSKGDDYQAIVDGKYYRTVNFNFGFGPKFILDGEPTPERIKARIEGCKFHTYLGLEQINPLLAASLREAVNESQ